MAKTILATAAFLFATSIQAADSRQQFVMDNPDTDNSRGFYQGVTAIQSGVGAALDRYQGVADGNADLFNVMLDGQSSSHETPQIYAGAEGNPDLAF